MARTDTLGHFLTDVANAIRTKKETSSSITASNFDIEIVGIQTGSKVSYGLVPKIGTNFENTYTVTCGFVPSKIIISVYDSSAHTSSFMSTFNVSMYKINNDYKARYTGNGHLSLSSDITLTSDGFKFNGYGKYGYVYIAVE